MPLVDSIKKAKESVGEAFDQLVQDVEADEAAETPTGEGGSKLVKVVAYYEDGTAIELSPPNSDAADTVKDLTEQQPPKSDGETPPQTGSQETPGNAEQV